MNNAVQAAVMCNALGVLICDWSLPGHVNPLTVSIPALLAGAGFAWKASVDVVSSLGSFFVEFFRLATDVLRRFQQRKRCMERSFCGKSCKTQCSLQFVQQQSKGSY